MKIETWYHCPCCNKSWPTAKEAFDCRDTHNVIIEQIARCEICGAGWVCDKHRVYDSKAVNIARGCEEQHREKLEAEEIGTRVFFVTGGQYGQPTVINGGMQENG